MMEGAHGIGYPAIRRMRPATPQSSAADRKGLPKTPEKSPLL